MMFGSVHLSTAAGCGGCGGAPATSGGQYQQKAALPKVRYGAFFAGMADAVREEEEYFAKRAAMKAKSRRGGGDGRRQGGEEQKEGGGTRRGLSRRLLGKLVRLISVKDFPFLPIAKTFPSRDAKKAAAAAAGKRRPHNSSQSSTLSGSFEPMPTIEEETESELMQQLADAWEREEEEREQRMMASPQFGMPHSSSSIVQAAA